MAANGASVNHRLLCPRRFASRVPEATGAEFAALVTHDLTEPLRRIELHVDLLVEAVTAARTQEAKALANEIRHDASAAKAMAEAACHVMSGDVRRLDADHVRSLAVEATDLPPGFQLRWKEPIPAVEMPVEFAYTIRNLVRNAIKHHDRPEGVVELSYTKPWFHVTDDGPGFDSLEIAKSKGLGLRLVEQLVGGQFVVTPAQPRGTRVSFAWPIDVGCREPVADDDGTQSVTHVPEPT